VLDLKQIRRDPEPVRAALARRGDGSDARLDRVLELDARTRELRPHVESLKAEQNAASKAIGAAK
jgi:seryl-tRNA synthetase